MNGDDETGLVVFVEILVLVIVLYNVSAYDFSGMEMTRAERRDGILSSMWLTIVQDPFSWRKACWRGSNGDGRECEREEAIRSRQSLI